MYNRNGSINQHPSGSSQFGHSAEQRGQHAGNGSITQHPSGSSQFGHSAEQRGQHAGMTEELKKIKEENSRLYNELREKERINKSMTEEVNKIKEENSRLYNELQEKERIIKRFGIVSAQRFQATGQAIKVDADNPVEIAKETLDDLWEKFYRPACLAMEVHAVKKIDLINSKLESVKNPVDYLDIIMTEALQKSFNDSMDKIKDILLEALEQRQQHHPSEDFMQMLTNEPKSTITELVNSHYEDPLTLGDRKIKNTPIYKEWMVFAQEEIGHITPEKIKVVQDAAKHEFKKKVNKHMKKIYAEFQFSDDFVEAAQATANTVWKMITMASPILLKSYTMRHIKDGEVKFNPTEMKVHAGSAIKTTQVEAFAEPIVISSKTGGVIIQGSVFCKKQFAD